MLVIRSSWFLVLPLRSHKINSSIRTENSLYAQNAHIISILNVRPRHYVELLRYWSLIVMKKKENLMKMCAKRVRITFATKVILCSQIGTKTAIAKLR